MTEFQRNSIVAAIAAFLAFLFSFILERLKRSYDTRQARVRSRDLALLALRATQKILEQIKSRYQANQYFDYIYIGQLKEIARQLDSLRFNEQFFAKKIDQSTFFDTVSRLHLIAANMEANENVKNNPQTSGNKPLQNLVARRETEYNGDLSEINQKIEDLINILSD
jgi:hypothetical protein